MNQIAACNTKKGIELFKVVEGEYAMGVAHRVRIHDRLFPYRNLFMTLTGDVCHKCPLCEKDNLSISDFSALVVKHLSSGEMDIALFEEGSFIGYLGAKMGVMAEYNEADYQTILKLRPYRPTSRAYLLQRIGALGLAGTMYEQAILMHFLEFANKKDVMEALSVHRTTVARAIKKISGVCQFCGY